MQLHEQLLQLKGEGERGRKRKREKERKKEERKKRKRERERKQFDQQTGECQHVEIKQLGLHCNLPTTSL